MSQIHTQQSTALLLAQESSHRTATAAGRIVSAADGKLLARSTSTLLVLS